MDSDEQQEILILRCQIGDRDAFEELFEKFQPRLRYYLRHLDQSSLESEDILQEIWLTVLRKIGKLKEPQAFTAWLYKIARNMVYKRLKKDKKFVQLDEENLPAEVPEKDFSFSLEDAQKIHQSLKNIQPQHREVLALFFLERLSYQAIAEITDCTIGTIKSRIYYAKKSLRKEMEAKNE